VQIVAVLLVLLFTGRAEARRAVTQRLVASEDTARSPRGWRDACVLGLVLGVTIVFLAAPLLALVVRSLRPGGMWTLAAYRALGSNTSTTTLFVSPWTAVRNSLVFAAIATLIALAVGGLAAVALASRPGRRARLADAVLMLPLGTSAVTVGFGFLIAFDRPPLDVSTTSLLIPIAQAVVAIPFVVRIVAPALRSIDPRLRDAATMLGAPPRRVWREVDLPIVLRAFAVAAGFCAAVSLGEFGATQRFLGRPGEINVGQSFAMATILMVLTGAVVFAIERVRVRGVGEL
jgi:thiamine transport system permease protein